MPDGQYEPHRLLRALLSKRRSADGRLSIVEKEYDIPIENNVKKDISVMCNLSQGIRDDESAADHRNVVCCFLYSCLNRTRPCLVAV